MERVYCVMWRGLQGRVRLGSEAIMMCARQGKKKGGNHTRAKAVGEYKYCRQILSITSAPPLFFPRPLNLPWLTSLVCVSDADTVCEMVPARFF